jgi:hypothetical protein
MQVKGTAIFARAKLLKAEFGDDQWENFIAEFGKQNQFFAKPLLPTTLIPLSDFLAINDAIIEKFYAGDKLSYWKFGEQSAQWSLTDGPYRHVLGKKSLRAFVDQLSKIWDIYYDEGELEVTYEEQLVHLHISGLPTPHVYFEYVTIGYIKRAMELAGAKNVKLHKVAGVDLGTGEIRYQVRFSQ